MKRYFLLLNFLLPFLVNAQTSEKSYKLTEQDRKNYVLHIDQEDMNDSSKFEVGGRPVRHARLTLKNNSNDTLKFWTTGCAWGGFYKINNKNMDFFELDCLNICSIVSLAPHQIYAMDMKLFYTKNTLHQNYKFRLGMNLFKYSKNDKLINFEELTAMCKQWKNNLIWSNEVVFDNKVK